MTWREAVQWLAQTMGPREASAEVAARDRGADRLFMRTLTGPQTLPSYVQTLQMALDRPESVDVATMKRMPDAEGSPVARYYEATGQAPGLVAVAPSQLIPESTRRALAAVYQSVPENPYDLGWASPEQYGKGEQVLSHELGHFLAQMYGLQLEPGMEERVVQRQATEPIDYPLLRAAWVQQQRKGEAETPYWAAVRRQMERR
jgi:hypothetical protein